MHGISGGKSNKLRIFRGWKILDRRNSIALCTKSQSQDAVDHTAGIWRFSGECTRRLPGISNDHVGAGRCQPCGRMLKAGAQRTDLQSSAAAEACLGVRFTPCYQFI